MVQQIINRQNVIVLLFIGLVMESVFTSDFGIYTQQIDLYDGENEYGNFLDYHPKRIKRTLIDSSGQINQIVSEYDYSYNQTGVIKSIFRIDSDGTSMKYLYSYNASGNIYEIEKLFFDVGESEPYITHKLFIEYESDNVISETLFLGDKKDSIYKYSYDNGLLSSIEKEVPNSRTGIFFQRLSFSLTFDDKNRIEEIDRFFKGKLIESLLYNYSDEGYTYSDKYSTIAVSIRDNLIHKIEYNFTSGEYDVREVDFEYDDKARITQVSSKYFNNNSPKDNKTIYDRCYEITYL